MKCFIFIIITKSFDLLNRDYLSFILSIGLIISILIIEFFFVKKMVYELYNKEYTLVKSELEEIIEMIIILIQKFFMKLKIAIYCLET